MKKLFTTLSILLIATASYAQVQSVNSDVRKINDYKHKPGGYQRLIADYQKIPDTQAQGLEKYMQLQTDYQQTQTNEETYTVERVIDGDTIVVTTPEGKSETVELIGIDAPESQPNDKAKRDAKRTGQDLETIIKMGQEATEFVKILIKPGQEVRLEFDVQKKDKYGRLLGYVLTYPRIGAEFSQCLYDGEISIDGNRFWYLNAQMIACGYATPMTIPPNVKYADLFAELYEEARKEGRGLWKDDNEAVKTQIRKIEVYEDIGCPDSVKQCPDGSFMHRGGPDCDFDPCPE